MDNYVFKYNKNLHELNFQKILVEGGAKTASSFLNKGFFDFMYIYRANSFYRKPRFACF